MAITVEIIASRSVVVPNYLNFCAGLAIP